jgi:hypothetical protein
MIIKKDRIYIYDCELKENLINEFKNLKGKHYKNLDSKGSGWSFSINYLSQINNLLNLIPTIQNNIVENKDEQDNIVENKDIQNNIVENKDEQDNFIENEYIQNNIVENKDEQDNFIENEYIQNNILENEYIQNNIVENKDIQNNILTNKHLLNIEQLKKIKYNIEKKIPKTPFSSPIKHRYKYDISKKLIKKFEKYLII